MGSAPVRPCAACKAEGARKGEFLPRCEHCDPIGYAEFRKEQIDYEIDAELRRRGWRHTSEVGAIWLWERKLADGRTVLVTKNTAIALEEGGITKFARAPKESRRGV